MGSGARLGERVDHPAPVPGVRVIIDARPLQEPERAPITALYLRELLAAFARRPVPGESFMVLYEAGAPERRAPRGAPGRGSPAPPADAIAALRGPHGRSVLPPRRGVLRRPGGARMIGRRRGRLPRGRRVRAARDPPPAGGDAPRSRAVGAAGALPADDAGPVRAAVAGAHPPRRGRGHRPGRSDRCHRPTIAARAEVRGAGRAAGAAAGVRGGDHAGGHRRGPRAPRPGRAATSSTRVATTPGTTSRRCSPRWPASR